MDQAKLDEMAAVTGGLDMLDGAIGVLPLVYDERAAAQSFVKRYKEHHDTAPNTEASLNYTALYIVTDAMKAAGAASDAKAIRASLGAAIKGLTPEHNPNTVTSITEHGGLTADAYAGAVENGKIVQVPLTVAAR